MKLKPILGIITTVATVVALLCVGAVIHRRWSEQVIKLKRGEGWTLVAKVDAIDFTHPWNNLAKAPETIWFAKPDTVSRFNGNIVFFRALTVDLDGIEDTPLVAFNCSDKETAVVVPPEFRPSKFQWRNYEPAFTAQIAKIACR